MYKLLQSFDILSNQFPISNLNLQGRGRNSNTIGCSSGGGGREGLGNSEI